MSPLSPVFMGKRGFFLKTIKATVCLFLLTKGIFEQLYWFKSPECPKRVSYKYYVGHVSWQDSPGDMSAHLCRYQKCAVSLNWSWSPVILLLKKPESFNWSWPRMCQSSLAGAFSSSTAEWPVPPSTYCPAACPYTWLWFVALLKLCLFNSCKWNAKGGQCPSTHLLVSGLSRPQSRFCLIQTEAKLWGKCTDNFDDRQQQSFTPPHIHTHPSQ